jgi:O-acetyl-ADP-ribose deacetylase (regulator of RNase III)
MISFVKGNMLLSEADALVNTVNTVGVMGKGIALQFKERYPDNHKVYQQACKKGELHPGDLLIHRENGLHGSKIIINFATKGEWYQKSQYQWIEKGLAALPAVLRQWGISSVALPPLGCGNGGLDWAKVKPMIEQHLAHLTDAEVYVYEPDQSVLAAVRKTESNKEVKLTTPKALLLYALFQREAYGEETSLFAANKMAYFLQAFGEKQLKLRFIKHIYGPYSNQVDHLMTSLNGKYLHGLVQREAKAFDVLQLNYAYFEEVKAYYDNLLVDSERIHLDLTLDFLQGFYSPLSMEALASVHSILSEDPTLSDQAVYESIRAWSTRKSTLFSMAQIRIVYAHVKQFEKDLLPID